MYIGALKIFKMRKLFVFLLLISISIGYCQKKKSSKKPSSSAKVFVAKLDHVSAEIITINKLKTMVLFVKKSDGVDTLEVKKIVPNNFKPLNFTLKSYQAKGKKFYYIQWEEKNKISTKLKQEDQDLVYTQIWNIETKELLLGNTQTSSHIIETVYLDHNKTASETQEKNRKEGFEFQLLPNGDFILKNKTQNNTYTFDTSSMKYIPLKTISTKNTKRR